MTRLNLLAFDFNLLKTLASSQITISLFMLPKFHIGPDWGRNSSKMKKLAKCKGNPDFKSLHPTCSNQMWSVENGKGAGTPYPPPPSPPLYFEYLPIGLGKERRRDRDREKLLFNLGREEEGELPKYWILCASDRYRRKRDISVKAHFPEQKGTRLV